LSQARISLRGTPPEGLAHGFVELFHDGGGFHGGCRLGGGQGQFGGRLLVRGEQGFEAGAQGGVAFAHNVEEHGAFLRRLIQHQGKQSFFG
jgi:hypothetical protein